jgi:hypothetical protein
MKFLTEEEVKRWCRHRGVEVTSNKYLFYDRADAFCLSVVIENLSSTDVLMLAEYLMPNWIDVPFEGALLWIRERGIWGEFVENTGAQILSQLRFANGDVRPPEESPGSVFAEDEIFGLHSYFILPMLFGWDAFLVPNNADYIVFVSHDGFVGVVCRTAEKHEETYHRLRDWHPRREAAWYTKRVPSGSNAG